MNALYEWYKISEELARLKVQEAALRKQVFDEYFPEPHEGTNKVEIPGDATLVATLPYRYTIDVDAMDDALEQVPASKRDKLISWKPSLHLATYRSLSKKAMTAFTAECLSIKPGTPSLKIVTPDS